MPRRYEVEPRPRDSRRIQERRGKDLGLGIVARLDLAATIVLDTGVIATAYLARAGLLWLMLHLTPPHTRDLAIEVLEWIANIGMIGTALIFTAFDLLKRLRSAISDAFDGSNRG